MSDKAGHCPHLGLKQNRAIRFDSPTSEHRCYVTGDAQDIPVDQPTYCLSQNHVKCPLYMGLDVPTTNGNRRSRPQHGLYGWLQSLPPRERFLYSGMLFFTLMLVVIYATLFVQYLTTPAASPTPTPDIPPTSQLPTTAPDPSPSPDSLPIPAPDNMIRDGSFEQGSPNPHWIESSNIGPIICTEARCPTDNPAIRANTGSAWVWFGRTNQNEISSISQEVTIPVGNANVAFWLKVPAMRAGSNDFLRVSIDGFPVFKLTSANANEFAQSPDLTSGYTRVIRDVSRFADGQIHTLTIDAEVQSDDEASSTFLLDDVVLVVTHMGSPIPPPPAPTTTPITPDAPTTPDAPDGNAPSDQSQQTSDSSVLLYFASSDQSMLIPVTRHLSEPSSEPQELLVLQELLRGPAPESGLVSAFPPDTMLLDVERKQNRVHVSLNTHPDSAQALDALVLTLTELPGVQEVMISVDGVALSQESLVRPLRNVDTSRPPPDDEPSMNITLYFPHQIADHIYYVPVTRQIPRTRSPVRETINELLSIPPATLPLTSPIPPTTMLRTGGVNPSSNGGIILNLTSDFFGTSDHHAATTMIALTLTDIRDPDTNDPLYHHVQILVEGQPLGNAWGSAFAQPLQRPPLNPEE